MEINACLDSYDERNYDYSELAGSSDIPDKVLLDTGYRQNQALDGFTNGCVYYSASEGSNYLTKGRLLGKEFVLQSNTRSSTQGDYIINGAKLLVAKGIIKGYAQVNTLDAIKNSIASGRPILTGSNKINWTKTKASIDKIAVVSSGARHAFHIIGYDDLKEVLICKNSYGPDYMDKGNFYIKYSDITCLMNTKVSIIENQILIDNYKNKIMSEIKLESAKIGYALGLYNGIDGTLTKEQGVAIIERAIEGMLNGTITKEKIEEIRKGLV